MSSVRSGGEYSGSLENEAERLAEQFGWNVAQAKHCLMAILEDIREEGEKRGEKDVAAGAAAEDHARLVAQMIRQTASGGER